MAGGVIFSSLIRMIGFEYDYLSRMKLITPFIVWDEGVSFLIKGFDLDHCQLFWLFTGNLKKDVSYYISMG